ncbi:MAG TPA: NADH-quinone oxidoreductase subunit N [Pirellulales bacterium]|nr:NADH-quinone oxidoreductase subunit N [Pirellulales bacterium]
MNFQELVNNLRLDTIDVSLPGFRPELAICATIVVMLLLRLPRFRVDAFYVALAGSVAALVLAAPWRYLGSEPVVGGSPYPTELFTGMLLFDGFTVYFRSVLLIFAVLFLVMTRLSGIPDSEDGADFYTLILGATLGMCIMASANHLLMIFLGVEMASVPSYALAGILKGRRQSSEAALKYSVFGAGTAGVMLYGISLLAGATGSAHIPTIVSQLTTMSAEAFGQREAVLMLGGLMMAVGLAFKLSAVPFHFWCPDVFEGASAEVDAFLSVASKAAAMALLIRVGIGFAHQAQVAEPVALHDRQAQVTLVANVQDVPDAEPAPGEGLKRDLALIDLGKAGQLELDLDAKPTVLERSRDYIVGVIAFLAAITCTFGNLAAYAQTNIKRLFAYSTIAHAGYMMMPAAAAVALIGRDDGAAEQSVAAVAFYVGVYLFMNLGAFAVVAFLRNAMRSEEIKDYAGLIRTSPGLVVCFSIILISLIGLPFFSGFIAKWLAFYALVPAKLYWLLVVGGLNTALSLFYYLRIVKTMTMDPEPADRLPVDFSMVSAEGAFVALITLPVVVLGVAWDQLYQWAAVASHQLLN